MNRKVKRYIKKSLSICLILIMAISVIVFAKSNEELFVDGDNVAPISDFSADIMSKKNINLVIATDYSGQKLADLNSKLQEMKMELIPHKINVNFELLTDKKNISNQSNSVPIYHYNRYFKINFKKTGYEQTSGSAREQWNNTPDTRLISFESVQLNKGEPLPQFEFSNDYVFRKIGSHVPYQGMGWAYIYDEYELYDSNNRTDSRKTFTFNTTFSSSSYYSYMNYSITSSYLENSWTLSNITTNEQENEYKSIDFQNLNNLKFDGDNYLLFVSDAEETHSYNSWGNYYSFADLSIDNISNFITNNNCNVYTVVSEKILDLKINKNQHDLTSEYNQDLSLKEALNFSANEKQVYSKGQFNNAIDHIIHKYTNDTTDINKIDLLVATDYSNTKKSNLITELNLLKSNLNEYNVDLNYNLIEDKVNVSNTVINKGKLDANYSGHRIYLKSDGTLWYFKKRDRNKYSLIDPDLIFEQYPKAKESITPQTYTRNSRRYNYSIGRSFAYRLIPPVKISDDVQDFVLFNYSMYYLKNNNLYLIKNSSGDNQIDNYVTKLLVNGENIEKIVAFDNTLYAIKTDGTLWCKSNNPVMYAPGTKNRDNYSDELKTALSIPDSLVQIKGNNIESNKIVDVSIGNEYVLALTEKGTVFSWGKGDYGQLGNRKSRDFSDRDSNHIYKYYPYKLNVSNITSIAAVDYSTYMTGIEGMVYFCGYAGFDRTKERENDPELPSSLRKDTVPSYINKSSCEKDVDLVYDYDYRTFYYRNDYFSTSIIKLYKNDKLIINNSNLNNIYIAHKHIAYSNGSVPIKVGKTILEHIYDSYYNTITSHEFRYGYDEWESYIKRNNYKSDYTTSKNSASNSKYVYATEVSPMKFVALKTDGRVYPNLFLDNASDYNNDKYDFTITQNDLLNYYDCTKDDLIEMFDTTYTTTKKSINTTKIQQLQLRSDAEHIFLYASDTTGSIQDDLNNYFSLNRLPNDFINYLNDKNFNVNLVTPYKNTSEENINKLLNTKYKNGIHSSTSAFINSYLKQFENDRENMIGIYAIVDEDYIDFTSSYTDHENDIKNNESWYYEHDPNYFENGNGLAIFNKQTLNKPINEFTNYGKYHLKYKAQDKSSPESQFSNYNKWSIATECDLYAHHRPVAEYSLDVYKEGVMIKETSYDLDHMSLNNKGIVEKKWRWKEVDSDIWNNGKITVIQDGKYYVVSLEVKDMEGVWSEENIQFIDTRNLEPAPMNLTMKLNPQYPSPVTVGSTFHVTAYVEYPSPISTVTGWLEGIGAVPLTKTKTDGIITTWECDYTVPLSFTKGDYNFYVKSVATNGTNKTVTDMVKVNDIKLLHTKPNYIELEGNTAPIKLKFQLQGFSNNAKIVIDLKDKNGNVLDSIEKTQEITILDKVINKNYIDSSNHFNYTVKVYSTFTSNLIIQKDYSVPVIIPTAGMKITSIKDIRWKNEPYPIDMKNFAVDINSAGEGIKMGYKIEFEFTTADYYNLNSNLNIDVNFYDTNHAPLDMYYATDTDNRVEVTGTNIYKNLTITGDGTGKWKGQYYLPFTSYAEYSTGTEYKGNVIVSFSIKGSKTITRNPGTDLEQTLTVNIPYVDDKWAKNKSSNYKQGDMFVYIHESADTDFEVQETH